MNADRYIGCRLTLQKTVLKLSETLNLIGSFGSYISKYMC